MSRAELERLKRLGFRKWYERRLIDGHAHLILGFLAVVIIACGFELGLAEYQGTLGFITRAVIIFFGLLLGWYAMQRYRMVLSEADFIGRRANCPRCQRYGFQLSAQVAPPIANDGLCRLLQAQCSRCGERWEIDLSQLYKS